jgi:hypothetical protein
MTGTMLGSTAAASAKSFSAGSYASAPENLIGDRAYDGDPLDEELWRDGNRAASRQS